MHSTLMQVREMLPSSLGCRLAAFLATAFRLAIGLAVLAALGASSRADQYSYDSMKRLTRVQYDNGSTIEYVYDNSGNCLMTTTAPAATSDHPPTAVSAPGIASGATNVPTSTSLSWTAASDADPGDAVAYYLYFGTSPNPPLVYSGAETNWSPGLLQCFTAYYWYVVSRDNHNAQTVGPLWTFVSGSVPPVADFSAASAGGQTPVSIQLTDRSVAACGRVVSWQWDFNNDGIVDSTSQNPVFNQTMTGDYTVKLTVQDADGGISSVVKTNFISVLNTNMVDLAPLALNIETAASYRNLVVTYLVTNRGAISVSYKWQWADTLYISTEPVINAGAASAATFFESQTLPPGAVYARTNLVPIPAWAGDSCYLILKVDSNSQIGEPNENNNLISIPLHGRLPDLVPGAFAYTGPALAGQSLDITYTATNRGALALRGIDGAEVDWYDGVYLSTNAFLDAQAEMIGFLPRSQTLDVSSGYAVTNSIFLPDVPPGNYYLILQLDSYREVAESDVVNNSLAVPLGVTAPDLRPLSLIAPNGAPSDQQVSIVYSVTNQSDAPARSFWIDELYLSTNAVWEAQAYLLGQQYEFGPVAGGGGYMETNLVRLPGWPAGNYYLILKVNSEQFLCESATNNNTLVVPFALGSPAGLPDLAPVALNAPASASAGQGVQVVYTVTNCGPLAATGVWEDVLWLSTNSVWGPDADYLGGLSAPSLVPAHGSYTATNDVNLPLVDPGQYYLLLQVDAFGQLYESETTNNFVSVPILVQPSVGLADLTPVSLNAPASAAPGQTISFTYTVANQGAVPATGSWMDAIWISTNAFFDNTASYLAFVMPSGPVPAGGNYVRTVTARVPMLPAGTYYLLLEVDLSSQVLESSYDNNSLAQAILLQGQVTLPDLAPTALIAPATASAGQAITVSYAVTNSGPGAALGTWYDELVLSTNAVWDKNDYMLGVQVRTQAVVAGGTYRVTNNVTLPAWTAGNYYFLLNVNVLNSLGETLTNNNVLSAMLSLSSLPPVVPWLGPAKFLSDSTFQLSMTGALGTNYTLQASTNLAQWVRVLDLTCTGTPTYVVDPGAKNFSSRLYRLAPFAAGAPSPLFMFSPPPATTNGRTLNLTVPLSPDGGVIPTNLLRAVPFTSPPDFAVPRPRRGDSSSMN